MARDRSFPTSGLVEKGVVNDAYREQVAVSYEEQASACRRSGDFEQAVRWDHYARMIRQHGTTRGYTNWGCQMRRGEQVS